MKFSGFPIFELYVCFIFLLFVYVYNYIMDVASILLVLSFFPRANYLWMESIVFG